MSSSIELAKTALIDNEDKKADMLIFPILANANHGIELYLKALIWTMNKLLSNPNKVQGRHNIKQMLQTAKSRIKEYHGQKSLDFFNIATQDLQVYIDELYDRIQATPQQDKMDFSRYPFDDKYVNHFYVGSIGNIEVDLENLSSRFNNILEGLEERVSYYFYQELNEEW